MENDGALFAKHALYALSATFLKMKKYLKTEVVVYLLETT